MTMIDNPRRQEQKQRLIKNPDIYENNDSEDLFGNDWIQDVQEPVQEPEQEPVQDQDHDQEQEQDRAQPDQQDDSSLGNTQLPQTPAGQVSLASNNMDSAAATPTITPSRSTMRSLRQIPRRNYKGDFGAVPEYVNVRMKSSTDNTYNGSAPSPSTINKTPSKQDKQVNKLITSLNEDAQRTQQALQGLEEHLLASRHVNFANAATEEQAFLHDCRKAVEYFEIIESRRADAAKRTAELNAALEATKKVADMLTPRFNRSQQAPQPQSQHQQASTTNQQSQQQVPRSEEREQNKRDKQRQQAHDRQQEELSDDSLPHKATSSRTGKTSSRTARPEQTDSEISASDHSAITISDHDQ
ncbi:hypothetical protein KEM55_005377, partial [Ascosphaera atra]